MSKIEFTVGQLPEKKIADPKFPACPNHEIRVRNPTRVEIGRKHVLCQLILRQLSLRQNPLRRPQNLIPAAIIDGELKIEIGEILRIRFNGLD